MKAYVFQAALLCELCAENVKATREKPAGMNPDNEHTWDSDDWPKGPYENGGGEADCPQHCDHCGVFLENPLTDDGDKYVRGEAEAFEIAGADMTWPEIAEAARKGGKPVLADWIDFYFSAGM